MKELYRVLKPGGKLIIIEDIPKEEEGARLMQNLYDATMNTEAIGEQHSYKAPAEWTEFFGDVLGKDFGTVTRSERFGSDLRKDATQHSMFVLEKKAAV